MANEYTPDIWKLLFEQTPLALRWALGVMSAGLFTLATYIYQRNQRKVQEMEEYIDSKIMEVEKKMDFVNALAQRRDEHILQRLDTIDGRILTVLNTVAGGRR